MSNVTAEQIMTEAKRLYGARREEADPQWDDAPGFVQSYYLFIAKRRLA